ncbi:MAG TPA: sigma-54 dependent transcriptional regulator [Polyangiaceae bacterium]|nr:sigma-54 dependent transcriptional regulator [Polyangiaceae bacterium]
MTTRHSAVPAPPARPRVLYVDDEDDVREVFQAVFEGDFDVTLSANGADALARLAGEPFDVLVSDMRMDPMKGSELLARAYEQHRDVARLLLTGFSDHADLADAVNLGHVWAYVQKPWDAEQLRLTIQRAFETRRLELENRRLVDELKTANRSLRDDVEVVQRTVTATQARLQVSSPAMAKVLEQVIAVAGTDANVLLDGETGVGKELVAAAIHERSARKRGRFVAQNLAALPPELMTSELFGHVKGAFTGAQASRRGLFELADGGTLFLDEIGEAPPSLQAMLLRALESREIWPVGGSDPRRVDLRIIAATNRDLLAEAQAGSFRLDLYYRLAVAPIHIPPLRVRPEDVRGLGQPMLEAAARRMNRAQPRVIDSAWRALEQHAWPGNVRELSNLMERLVIDHAGHEVDVEELGLPAPLPGSAPSGTVRLGSAAEVPPAPVSSVSLAAAPTAGAGTQNPWSIVLEMPEVGTTFDDLEKEILAQVLARAEGNQSRAARSLGLSESTLRSRLKRLGLKGGST